MGADLQPPPPPFDSDFPRNIKVPNKVVYILIKLN